MNPLPMDLVTLRLVVAVADCGSISAGSERVSLALGAASARISSLEAATGGQVPIGVISAAAGIAQAKAGKLRAIALMSKAGLPGLENVAPLADALPGFDVAPRLMLLAPAGTPAAMVERLAEAVRVVLSNPDVIRAAGVQGAVPAYLPSAALAADLTLESASWGKIVKEQKITAQ